MGKIKVLMADDEEDILNIMAKKVTQAGYDVIKAIDGQDAWEKICNEVPDIIVLDLNMPKKDGFEVLKELRENPPDTKTQQPVIIVSARRELEDIKQGYEFDADHYISKPCDVEDIIKSIALMVKLLPQRKTSQEIREDGG
ncbi:MAG: response regulator [Candidatus Omnitrophica bacterium]|nr:response regulator [Candidatus Omnitrophota bacterium]